MDGALIRRIAATVPLLLVISAGVFGLLHLVPGGPLAVYLSNPDVRPEFLRTASVVGCGRGSRRS